MEPILLISLPDSYVRHGHFYVSGQHHCIAIKERFATSLAEHSSCLILPTPNISLPAPWTHTRTGPYFYALIPVYYDCHDCKLIMQRENNNAPETSSRIRLKLWQIDLHQYDLDFPTIKGHFHCSLYIMLHQITIQL